MPSPGLYAIDGSINVTVVTGVAYTGLYAPDGSINVIKATGSTFVGAYHPCGAWWVTIAIVPTVGALPLRAPDGSLYVSVSPYTNGAQHVTVVSGSLVGGLVLDGITTGIKAAYSTRKLLTAYAGNAIQVQRISDNTTQNIGFVANVLDTATLATFCSGTTGKVITWYDQSGGGFNQTSAAIATAPIIFQAAAVNAINTKPAILFVAANNTLLSNGSLSPNPVNTLFQNAVVSVNTTTQFGAITGPGVTAGGLVWRVDQTNGDLHFLADLVASIATSTSGVTSLTGAVVESQYNSSTGLWSFWLNAASVGTGTQIQAMTANTSSTIGSGVSATGVELMDGSIGEIIMYDQVGSFASRTTIEANQKVYWGTP